MLMILSYTYLKLVTLASIEFQRPPTKHKKTNVVDPDSSYPDPGRPRGEFSSATKNFKNLQLRGKNNYR
jgi:hypothetical protein